MELFRSLLKNIPLVVIRIVVINPVIDLSFYVLKSLAFGNLGTNFVFQMSKESFLRQIIPTVSTLRHRLNELSILQFFNESTACIIYNYNFGRYSQLSCQPSISLISNVLSICSVLRPLTMALKQLGFQRQPPQNFFYFWMRHERPSGDISFEDFYHIQYINLRVCFISR